MAFSIDDATKDISAVYLALATTSGQIVRCLVVKRAVYCDVCCARERLPDAGQEARPCVYVQSFVLLPESREGYSE